MQSFADFTLQYREFLISARNCEGCVRAEAESPQRGVACGTERGLAAADRQQKGLFVRGLET